MASITTAAEARKKRGGPTLVERVMRDPERAARIDELVKAAELEQMVQAIMDIQHISAAELARRVNAKPPQISRDLHGGLRRATVARLVLIAEALDYEFVPALVPRAESVERDQFFAAYRALIPPQHGTSATESGESRDTLKPKKRRAATRT